METIDISVIWLIVAIVCIIIELGVVSTLAFFFAAFAAVMVGLLVEYGGIDSDEYVTQIGIFLGLTFLTMAFLWKPLKRWKSKGADGKESGYQNMVGDRVIVGDEGLKKGFQSQVSWSGTHMHAQLADDADVAQLDAGATAHIVAVEGNLLIVR